MILDNWQKEVVEHRGNLVLCSGRQVGKSFAISRKAGEYAVKNRNKSILVIASVERQAYLLLEKILSFLELNYKNKIEGIPTKHKIQLINGSVIHCLPTGLTGYGIRGYTIDLLIADEAAFIPEEVWTAVTPMLAITRGTIVLLSTPHGTGSYFHRCFSDPTFKKFHISSEDCPRKDQDFLDREKDRMTKLQYAQEYLGEFIDNLKQVFPDTLIKECMTQIKQSPLSTHNYYLGVDIARMGEDESTFEVLDATNTEIITQVENTITSKTFLTETEDRIIQLDKRYHFHNQTIGIDDAGLGAGVFDRLMINPKMRKKVVGLNNAKKLIDYSTDRETKVMKEDMYNNLKSMMERGVIQLLKDDEIFQSLKSVQYDYSDTGKTRFFGNYTHIAEGLIRAAWLTQNRKVNKLWISYI